MYHELDQHKDSMFVTLTYSDDYLPENYSIKKTHAQKWLKRLRKNIGDKRIRYFLCGEYGTQTQRPHYHTIIYGLGLKDRQSVIETWPYCDWTQPSILNKSFGLVEPASIQYVAGYVLKKLNDQDTDLLYTQTGREACFRLSSQGLGRDYADKNITQLNEMEHVTLHGVKHTIPRYYIKRLDLSLSKENQIDKDCELTENRTGLYISSEDLYKSAIDEVLTYHKADKASKKQRELNKAASIAIKQAIL